MVAMFLGEHFIVRQLTRDRFEQRRNIPIPRICGNFP